jgi:hypothetical protein
MRLRQPVVKPKHLKITTGQLKPSTPVVPLQKKSLPSQTTPKLHGATLATKANSRSVPSSKKVREDPHTPPTLTVAKKLSQGNDERPQGKIAVYPTSPAKFPSLTQETRKHGWFYAVNL